MTCQNCATVPIPQDTTVDIPRPRPRRYRGGHRRPGPLAAIAAVLVRAWRDDTPDTLPLIEMAGAR